MGRSPFFDYEGRARRHGAGRPAPAARRPTGRRTPLAGTAAVSGSHQEGRAAARKMRAARAPRVRYLKARSVSASTMTKYLDAYRQFS
eukprot:11216990-Lingulodinium_polyedra.AAC.1